MTELHHRIRARVLKYAFQRAHDGPVRILLARPSLPAIETMVAFHSNQGGKPIHYRAVGVLKRKNGIIPAIHRGHDGARGAKINSQSHVRAAIAMKLDCSA